MNIYVSVNDLTSNDLNAFVHIDKSTYFVE